MEWKNTTSDGLPSIGEPVLLYSNGVIQHAVYYVDASDNDLSLSYFWATEDCRLSEEAIPIKESDRWVYLEEVPKPK